MAEETRPPEPPKIKLGLGNIKPPTGSLPLKPVPGSGAPPKIKIQSAEKKSETARIDLTTAQPPPAIQPGEFKELNPEEMAEFYKKSTIRIESPDDAAAAAQRLEAAKRSTMRVEAETPAGETQKVKGETHSISGAAKAATIRVDSASAPAGKTETHRISDAVKKSTIRVDSGVEQKKKSETAKLEIPPSELNKRSTSRIPITADASKTETDDVFKKRTMPVSVPTTPPPAPARPASMITSRPKTITMRAPPAAGMPISPAPAEAVSEAKKSETARLDLPPETAGEERPVTRPKTIRIKRPDGTSARKALTISRPTEEAVFTPAAAAEIAGLGAGAEDQPGAVWTLAALAAVLVAAALVYVLAAQTIAASLPWPGKIL
jgi:hypothetical protein